MGTYCPMCGARVDIGNKGFDLSGVEGPVLSGVEGPVLSGVEGCQALLDRLLEKQHSGPDCAVHLLAVDCYALQHSDARRPQANAFHLLRLGWILLRDKNPVLGKTGLDFKRYAADMRNFPFFEPPETKVGITVADAIAVIDDSEECRKAVRLWAEAVWKAWDRHHAWVYEKLEISFCA